MCASAATCGAFRTETNGLRAADVPRTVALERGGGDDELRFFTAAAYRDKVYLMNLDMHATRKVTAVVKGRKIAAALAPLEVREIER